MKGSQIICAVRQIPVARTPEECVRQALLGHLFHAGGYAQHLTRVEMPIEHFLKSSPSPFSSSSRALQRRLDIVCFHTKGDSISPLLLIECKATRPQLSVVGQLLGYNFYVKAPFIAVAWGCHIELYNETKLCYEGVFEKMPTYESLKSIVLEHPMCGYFLTMQREEESL